MAFNTASLTFAALSDLNPPTLVSKVVTFTNRIFSIISSSESPRETISITSLFESGLGWTCELAMVSREEIINNLTTKERILHLHENCGAQKGLFLHRRQSDL